MVTTAPTQPTIPTEVTAVKKTSPQTPSAQPTIAGTSQTGTPDTFSISSIGIIFDEGRTEAASEQEVNDVMTALLNLNTELTFINELDPKTKRIIFKLYNAYNDKAERFSEDVINAVRNATTAEEVQAAFNRFNERQTAIFYTNIELKRDGGLDDTQIRQINQALMGLYAHRVSTENRRPE